MCTHPLVSTIICAYNAQDFIFETLDSVFSQTYENLEVIVVDDGSTDSTGSLIKSVGQQVVYQSQINSGSARARNTGILMARGDLLCFFDADDIMVPDRIASQVEFMNRYPELGLTFVDYRNFHSLSQPSPGTHFQTCPFLQHELQGNVDCVLRDARQLLLVENFGITGTMMLRKRMLKHEAGFEPSLRGAEDFHFYYRLARHTPVGILNRVGMLRRLHAGNKSLHKPTALPSLVRTYSDLLATETSPQARQLLRDRLALQYQSFARFRANNRRFREALECEMKAMAFGRAPKIFLDSLRNIARTVAIAIGLHQSTD
jgi:glycosyltransferase involved in cell wall biosynthesis